MNRETIKNLLRPDLRKIILAIISLVISCSLTYEISCLAKPSGYYFKGQPVMDKPCNIKYSGVPLPSAFQLEFQTAGKYKNKFAFRGCGALSCVFEMPNQTYLHLLFYFLFLNFIIWYFISCLLISIRDKYLSRK